MAKHEDYCAVRAGSFKISLMYPLAASRLPQDIYVKVFTLYEMLRIADIIEDSKISNKKELLTLHSESLFKERYSSEIENFVLTTASTSQEKAAAGYYRLFFDIYTGLPESTKTTISSTNKAMIPAMIDESYNDIKTWNHQNIYAGYVAGEVGVGLTKIFSEHLEFLNLEDMIKLGYAQGIALQKVNILRDLKEDISLGRNYIPEELLKQHHLKRSDVLNVQRPNGSVDDSLFDVKESDKYLMHKRMIQAIAFNAQYFLDSAVSYLINIPIYERKDPRYEYSRGIRIFCTALLLAAQEISYDIHKNPSLAEKKYSPKYLLLKHGLLSQFAWHDNDKLLSIIEKKKIGRNHP